MDNRERSSSVLVAALYCYPIKSCRGVALERAVVDARGIVHDRQWMIVDARGAFVTQRELPRLALLQPAVSQAGLTLTAPAMPPLDVPAVCDGERQRVKVWRATCAAVDQGDAVGDWLSAYLGTACRLVRMADDFVRRVNQPDARSAHNAVGFADAYPFLLISRGSLDDLNTRLPDPLPMNRFRPNIVVEGCPPYAEDGWRDVRIGELVLHRVKSCTRCAITTTDQETAAVGHEPLATLATYRRHGRGVTFGQYLLHERTGVLQVGDAVVTEA